MFLGSDHVETFSVTCIPSFAIIAGSVAVAKFAGRTFHWPVHREMAEDVLNKLVVEHDFDVAYSEDVELGHAFAAPLEHVTDKRDIPIIPFFTNVYVPALPTPKRCAALGRAIAQIVRGHKERVAVIASGGMAHFPGTRKYLSLNSISTGGSWRSSRRAAATTVAQQYGRFKFQNQGYQC